MKINDCVYGEEEINERVLIDLINSNPIQRLKKISQWGMPSEYYHKNSFSRYEHSIGVLILLRKLNASLKEQIAGLLHDVSHTAFSHVVDWAIGDPTKEDYQDKIHLEIIESSDIPDILKKHDFNYKEVSDIENFSLLEKPTPGLCADRIDYTLRELEIEKGFDFVKNVFLDLIVKNNQIVFKNKKTAEIFGKEYLRLNKEHWAGNEARARYYILSNVLKKAMEKEILFLEDMKMSEDSEIINLLSDNGDIEILDGLNLLKKGFKIIEVSNESEGVILRKKFRYIDPEIFLDESIVCLSDISEEYCVILEREKQNSSLIKKFIISNK